MCRPEMTVRTLPLETAEFARTILLKEISVAAKRNYGSYGSGVGIRHFDLMSDTRITLSAVRGYRS